MRRGKKEISLEFKRQFHLLSELLHKNHSVERDVYEHLSNDLRWLKSQLDEYQDQENLKHLVESFNYVADDFNFMLDLEGDKQIKKRHSPEAL